MIRAKIWFKCAAVHDPVAPIIVKPSIISWQAKFRNIELTIKRAFSGEELLKRMKGWITVNPIDVIDEVNKFGKLKILDDKELVVEFKKLEDYENLKKSIKERFLEEVDIELIQEKEYW